MKPWTFFLAVAMAAALAGCAASSANLPPTSPTAEAAASGLKGRALLVDSARKQGNGWDRYGRVEVSYDGEWSTFPKVTQPILVDPDFRGRSDEIYLTRQGLVKQTHQGPGGEKTVNRSRADGSLEVTYNGAVSEDPEVEAAAALVADAYAMFLFGASWLLEHGEAFAYLGEGEIEGRRCHLVEVKVRPGFGRSDQDRAVAWLDGETGWMRRVTFTIEGLDSTRGALVDVTADRFFQAPDGSWWPGHFIEMIRKPVNTQAHDWHTTALALDGKPVLREGVESSQNE